MLKKLMERYANKAYQPIPNGGYHYKHKTRNWTEYPLFDRIIYTHRQSTCNKLSDRLHAHNFYELYILDMDETLTYISDEGEILLRHGMAVLTKPNQFHAFRLTDPGKYNRIIIYFEDPAELFPDKNIMSFIHEGNDKYAVFDKNEDVIRYLRQVDEALSSEESVYARTAAYLRICDLFLALSQQGALTDPEDASSLPRFIREIKEYVDVNFTTIHTVEELTQEFFYSREHLSRSFKQYYNTPLYEYILERKVLYSAAFLERGERVSAAAEKAGFASPSTYIHHFRKYFGCSPAEYRIKNRS